MFAAGDARRPEQTDGSPEQDRRAGDCHKLSVRTRPPKNGEPETLLNEIRALIRQNAKSHREGIKALLTEYGVAKASLLPAEARAPFYEKLKGVLGA